MKNLLYILSLFSFQFAFAQSELPEGFGDYRTIENPEPYRAFCRVIFPTEFDETSKQYEFCLLDNNRHLLKNLEEGKDYEIRLETIEIKPQYTEYHIKPPYYYKNINSRFFISESSWEMIDSIPEAWKVGDTVINKVTVRKAYNQFVPFHLIEEGTQLKVNACLASNPNYAIIWHYRRFNEVQVNQRKVLHQINGQYQLETLSDTISYGCLEYKVNSAYQIIETIIPTEIDTFKTVHFLNNEIQSVCTTMNLTTYKIFKLSYLSEWRSIVCPSYCGGITSFTGIQKALKKLGYDVEVNHKFDIKTKKALIQFQKANGLPIGQLDIETLDFLNLY